MLGHIRLDIGIVGGVQPHAHQTIDTLIVGALSERRPDLDLDGFEDLCEFTLSVLHPGRTLVEKLVLVHTCATAAIDDPGLIAQQRIGRHFYDIHCLLGDPTTMSLVRSGDFDRVLDDAIRISRRHFGEAEERPADGFAASPAFADDGSPLRAAFEKEYRRVMDDFYFGAEPYPTFADVVGRVRKHDRDL